MTKNRFSFVRVVLILFLSIALFQSAAFSVDYQHKIKLRKIAFAWKIEGDKLYVRLTGGTKGWVGIGFNPGTKMQDANFVIGYVKKGQVKVIDAFGVRPKEHINDTAMKGQNNVTDVSGSQKGRRTTIEFAIPMDSGDSADNKLNADGYTTVLLAFGKGRDSFHSRHRFRTRLKVNLSTGQYRK